MNITNEAGFQLRRATPADQAALARFQVAAHWRADAPEASAYLATYTRELFTRPHPLLDVADFLLLATAADDEIVASVQLFRQTWHYAGIPLPVGQIEMVGTAAPYRRRGLARRATYSTGNAAQGWRPPSTPAGPAETQATPSPTAPARPRRARAASTRPPPPRR